MTALSEFDIIKKLVEKPTKIDPSFGNLNLQFIRLDATGAEEDEKPGDEEGSLEDTKKKVIRLSYSVWSALTKYLRNVVSYKQIALEIPGFAIFGPIIEKKGLKQISDSGEIEKIVDQVLAANAKSVAEFRAGKEKAFNALVGQVMKATRGKANPGQVNDILRRKLS